MKIYIGFLFILLLSFFLIGCSDKTNYTTDEPFIIVTYLPARLDDYRNTYPVNYALYEDGAFLMYTDEDDRLIINDDAPKYETKLNDYRVGKVKEMIQENKIWKLPRDISVDSEDGAFYSMTVNLTDKSKTVSGLNPDNESFFDIVNYMRNLGDKADRNDWFDDIEEYIWKNNPD